VTAIGQRAWVLDAGAGWHAAVRDGIVDEAGVLTLGPLPGKAQRIDGATDEHPWKWPAALCGNPRSGLYVVDASEHVVTHAAVAGPGVTGISRIVPVPTIGGEGSGARRLRYPRGIALLPKGAIAIADTGNHRVAVFSRVPYGLLHEWGARDAQGRPTPGSKALEFSSPWDVAVSANGTLYVADRGNHRVQRIRRDGTSLEPLSVDASMDPTSVAVARDGTVAVVDNARHAVWVFGTRRVFPQLLDGLDMPTSAAFSPAGRLYVGDEDGRIHVFQSAGGASRWEPAGSGVTGLDGAIERLWWWSDPRPCLLTVVAQRSDQPDCRLWMVDPEGGRNLSGSLVLGPLDSQLDRCQWHRLQLEASVPSGCSIDIESATFDDLEGTEPPPADYTGWTRDVVASSDNPDCLVQGRGGRRLWLRCSLRSNGQHAPSIRRVRVSYPRSSYVQYLPSVFQEDDESREFLDRFLGIFQSGFDDFDAAIDGISTLFDPFLVPHEHLLWLASWVALVVDPRWLGTDDRVLREQVARAVAAYRIRGTPEGLTDAIEAYAEVNSRVVEHFRLRRWPRLAEYARLDGSTPLWSRDVYQRLQLDSYSQVGVFRLIGRPEPAIEAEDWGAYKFSVFFQADPRTLDDTRARVERVVEREKPAQTEVSLCPVLPRFRVGVQATIGIDAVVGTISYAVLNQLATLNYDTILACSPEEQTLRALGSAVRPTVGETTRVP